MAKVIAPAGAGGLYPPATGYMSTDSVRGAGRKQGAGGAAPPPKKKSCSCRGSATWLLARCIPEKSAALITGRDIPELPEEQVEGTPGGPLWVYFRFHNLIRWHWVRCSIMAVVLYGYVLWNDLWLGFEPHHHTAPPLPAALIEINMTMADVPYDSRPHDYKGGMYALFIGAWKPLNAEGHMDARLKWMWYFANIIAVVSALYLPHQVRQLGSWRSTYPSIRHLLESGRIETHIRTDEDDASVQQHHMEHVNRLLNVNREHRGNIKLDLEVTISPGLHLKKGEVHIDIEERSLQRVRAQLNELGEHIVGTEVHTLDQKNYVDSLLGLSRNAPVNAKKQNTFEASLGMQLAQSKGKEGTKGIRITEVSEGGPAALAGVKKDCRIAMVNGHLVQNYEQVKHRFQAAPGPDIRVDIVGTNDCVTPCCIIKPVNMKRIKTVFIQILNVIVFIVMVAACAWAVRQLTAQKSEIAHKKKKGEHTSVKTLIRVSVCLVLVKAVFEKVSGLLGESAFGTTPEAREMGALVQRLIFKITVLIVVLWMTAFAEAECPEDTTGGVLLIFMLIDYLVGWLVQYIVPVILNIINYCKHKDSMEEPERERIIMHEEYLDVIYNQFVLYIAMPVFPGAALLGLGFNLFEGHIDKWKIRTGFVKPPDGSAADLHVDIAGSLLVGCLFLAVVLPIGGILYVINGNELTVGASGVCYFPDWKPVDNVATSGDFFKFQWLDDVLPPIWWWKEQIGLANHKVG